jgi:DNA-binding HxlR family transcriptional regulator
MPEPLRMALSEEAVTEPRWQEQHSHDSRRPPLRAISGTADDEAASATDREMIEATTAALALFSAKWKVELLYLLAAGVRRSSRLHEHLLVSRKVLTDALRGLERDGLVRRRVFAEVPVRVEYSLTPLGRSLTGPLFALCEWADQHFDQVRDAREAYEPENGRARSIVDGVPRFRAAFQARRD